MQIAPGNSLFAHEENTSCVYCLREDKIVSEHAANTWSKKSKRLEGNFSLAYTYFIFVHALLHSAFYYISSDMQMT